MSGPDAVPQLHQGQWKMLKRIAKATGPHGDGDGIPVRFDWEHKPVERLVKLGLALRFDHGERVMTTRAGYGLYLAGSQQKQAEGDAA